MGHIKPTLRATALLWQLKSDGSPLMRCELEVLEDGRHQLRVVRGRRREVYVQQDYADRASAIRLSTIVYRQLKDNGFHDVPPP